MEKDTLSEVIEEEKRIRGRLEEERRKAGERIREVKEQAEREVEDAERRLEESLGRNVSDAEAGARERAESVRRESVERDRRLRALDDETLKGVVARHIASILPEAP